MNDKVESVISLAQTVEKSKVRYDLISQIIQFLRYTESTGVTMNTLKGITLPGVRWDFENLLINALKHEPTLKDPPLPRIYGVEENKEIAIKSTKISPSCCSVSNCTLADFINYCQMTYLYNGERVQVRARPRKESLDIQFGWTDFCGEAAEDSIDTFVNMVSKHMKCGLAYVTFCLRCRRLGGQVKANQRLLGKEDVPLTFRDKNDKLAESWHGLEQVIINRLQQVRSVRLVYSVVYTGGREGTVPVVTLGYSVCLLPDTIKAIVENRIAARREMVRDNK